MNRFASIDALRAGQKVWLDGGFTCHLPGSTILCDDGDGLYFCCCAGVHMLDGQVDDESGEVIGVCVDDPGVSLPWLQASARDAIPPETLLGATAAEDVAS